MTSLITNLLWQLLSCKVMDKYQGDLNSFNSIHFPLSASVCSSVSSLADFNCSIIFLSFHVDYVCANLDTKIISYWLFFESLLHPLYDPLSK